MLMADVHPFRAWRYDLAQVGDLSDVVAPPYDVIDENFRSALYKKHPCNVIRVDFNREEPGDSSPDAKYARAAGFVKQWQTEGVWLREADDALYVYHQEFAWEGLSYCRKGFLGRCRLEEFGQGCVYPHEQTLSGPKADRLLLTKATKMNLSPVFGLYPDPETKAQTILEQAIIGLTPLEATDHLGVKHRIWPVTNREVINQVRDALKSQPIFIADGHHRYETSCNYRRWLREQGQNIDDNHPANFVLMMFVGMDDPGLAILPTHRLFSGLPDLTAEDLKAALNSNFKLDACGTGADGAKATWELVTADGGQNIFGFGTAKDGQWLLGRVTDASPMKQLAPDQSDVWRGLGVALLHKLVVEHCLKRAFPAANPTFKFPHVLEEVIEAQHAKACQLAVLVPPAEIGHVQAIASKLEKMPPKSTFFYPKLLTGLVFNPL
jgi:uncharacterized protein (DUF1015 family)